MKFEVGVTKRTLFLVAFLLVVIGSVFVYAITPNPGHDANTVGDGSTGLTFGGSSTFAGTAGSWYAFPGHLGVGQNSIYSPQGGSYEPNIYIKDADPNAGIHVESTGADTGDTYLSLAHNGLVKGSLSVKNGNLLINTHTDALLSNVGIATVTPTQKLDVNGYVKANGFCIGNNCASNWQAIGGSVFVAQGTMTVSATTARCNDVNGPMNYTVRDASGNPVDLKEVIVYLRPLTVGSFTYRGVSAGVNSYPLAVTQSQGILLRNLPNNGHFTIVAQDTNGHAIFGRIHPTDLGVFELCNFQSFAPNGPQDPIIDFVAFG